MIIWQILGARALVCDQFSSVALKVTGKSDNPRIRVLFSLS